MNFSSASFCLATGTILPATACESLGVIGVPRRALGSSAKIQHTCTHLAGSLATIIYRDDDGRDAIVEVVGIAKREDQTVKLNSRRPPIKI